jgi:cyanophycinase
MTDTEGMRPLNREEAQDPRLAARIAEATGIFLTGGNQLRLASVVAGTRLGAALVEQHRRGAVVAGTSAGASALSSHMIAFGRSGPSPKQRMAQLGAGLGLLPDVLIDQHFTERNRIGRLEALVAHSPSLLALGIDEDTAALIGPDRVLEVIGKGSVTILDGSTLVTDAHEVPRHRPLMVSGVLLHVLTSGYRFDLRSRRLLGPLQSLVEREASE